VYSPSIEVDGHHLAATSIFPLLPGLYSCELIASSSHVNKDTILFGVGTSIRSDILTDVVAMG